MQYIKIHSHDNVAVALADMAAGTVVTIDGDTVTLAQDIARGHKFTLRGIAKGDNVIKYGLPIGHGVHIKTIVNLKSLINRAECRILNRQLTGEVAGRNMRNL